MNIGPNYKDMAPADALRTYAVYEFASGKFQGGANLREFELTSKMFACRHLQDRQWRKSLKIYKNCYKDPLVGVSHLGAMFANNESVAPSKARRGLRLLFESFRGGKVHSAVMLGIWYRRFGMRKVANRWFDKYLNSSFCTYRVDREHIIKLMDTPFVDGEQWELPF